MCFTEATIFEIQRLGSIAPQAVPHRTLGDVTSGEILVIQPTIPIPIPHHKLLDFIDAKILVFQPAIFVPIPYLTIHIPVTQ